MQLDEGKFFVKEVSSGEQSTLGFRNTLNGMIRVSKKLSEVDILKVRDVFRQF